MHHILIVDDDSGYRRLCRAALERSGLAVTEAEDGAQALKLMRQQPFALLLTDIIMPGKEGLETIMEVRASHPDLRIIAMSGGGSMDAGSCLSIAQRLGAIATLEKPFTAEHLVSVVRAALPPAAP